MPALAKSGLQDRVDVVGQLLHLRDLRRARPAQDANVVLVAQRIVQRVALQEELEDRLGKARSLGDAIPLRHRARAHIAHDALHRNHLHRPHQRLALVQHADEVRRDAGRGELAHHVRIDLVVGLALLRQLGELHAVEGRHVVAIVHHEVTRVVRRVDRLGLSLVELLARLHRLLPVLTSRARRTPAPGPRCRSSPAHSPTPSPARSWRAPACCSAARGARR